MITTSLEEQLYEALVEVTNRLQMVAPSLYGRLADGTLADKPTAETLGRAKAVIATAKHEATQRVLDTPGAVKSERVIQFSPEEIDKAVQRGEKALRDANLQEVPVYDREALDGMNRAFRQAMREDGVSPPKEDPDAYRDEEEKSGAKGG